MDSDNIVSRVAHWQNVAEEHQRKQLINPFSEWKGASHRVKLQKDDPNYGRPVKGSKTETRGQKAKELIDSEIIELCYQIAEHGSQNYDGNFVVLFGVLFEVYTKVSNKLVGILMRARRQGIVHFEGEMLYQRRDDNVPITLYQLLDIK